MFLRRDILVSLLQKNKYDKNIIESHLLSRTQSSGDDGTYMFSNYFFCICLLAIPKNKLFNLHIIVIETKMNGKL